MKKPVRIFKTAWFAKTAHKVGIDDATLLNAVRQTILGQAADMGGGVFKKRINQNRHRAIILAKSGDRWVLEYLFSKQDKANIARDELTYFRKLAVAYASLTDEQVQQFLEHSEWMEINDDA